MHKSHLILGGARSGKSSYAEKITLEAYTQPAHKGELIYIATATAGDSEMANRITHHQARRNQQWHTIEEPTNLAAIISQQGKNSTILIDCLTLWLSNCLHQACWPAQKVNFLAALESTEASVFMVSNEVGSGIVPMGELSRQFVDESGWLHQQIAQICSHVTLVVAGLPMPLK